jgi:hypothetical protein
MKTILVWTFSLGAVLVGCGDSNDTSVYILPGTEQVVELRDGDLHWEVISEPVFGGGVVSISALAADDVWFFGRDVQHWDGLTVTRMPLVATGVPREPDLAHFAETAVFFDSTNIWAAGTALWHYDGTAWTENTELFPEAVEGFNRYEIAGDQTHLAVFLNTYLYGFEGLFSPVGAVLPPEGAFSGIGHVPGYLPFSSTRLFVANGVLGAVGTGINDAATLTVTPCLQNEGPLWSQWGTQFYSFLSGGIGQGGSGDSMVLTRAVIPKDFEEAGRVLLSDLPGVESDLRAFIGPPRSPYEGDENVSRMVGIAAFDGGAFYAVRGTDPDGEFTFLIKLEDGVARVMPDRIYGMESYALGVAGENVFLATAGGAILMGSPK